MRIALLTIWHEKNYGAELQAYATIRILRQLGHDVQLIDLRLSDAKKEEKNIKRFIADIIYLFSPERRKFNHFWKYNIPTTKRYYSLNQLRKHPPVADIYIVGSDQVWNPEITGNFATTFFLDFGDSWTKKISYASSFGSEVWRFPEMIPNVRDLLSAFSSISCRELSGVTLLKNTFNLNAVDVLDPTLLLDDYSKLIGNTQDKKTLVYYPLSYDSELENYALSLASQLGLTPVNNKKTKMLLGKISWNRVGIEEWVRNIAQSSFVITRSFHGLVFSIIYRRPFAVLASRNGRSDRLINLLNKLGLMNRMFANVEELHSSRPWEKEIDYDHVNILLNRERAKSMNYLKQALN